MINKKNIFLHIFLLYYYLEINVIQFLFFFFYDLISLEKLCVFVITE